MNLKPEFVAKNPADLINRRRNTVHNMRLKAFFIYNIYNIYGI